MRILILRSERRTTGKTPQGDYLQEFSASYADKVCANLRGAPDFCSACGPDCNACREGYARTFAANIAGVISFPPVLPHLLETPADSVPVDVPPHDVILALDIHEQVLLEIMKRCSSWGTRGVVAPIEAPGWITPATRLSAEAIARETGLEVAFPKPFCAFDPPSGTVLAEFREYFHIGKPEVKIEVRDERIASAEVKVSAACGATYYVARWLVGKRVDEELEHDVVSRRMHSYPCTASMKWDDEINETILHVAGDAHAAIVAPLTQNTARVAKMIKSPVGVMVQSPVPVQENVQKIEKAKEAILAALAKDECVSLTQLRVKRNLTSAAASTALLILKQEGKVKTRGQSILKA